MIVNIFRFWSHVKETKLEQSWKFTDEDTPLCPVMREWYQASENALPFIKLSLSYSPIQVITIESLCPLEINSSNSFSNCDSDGVSTSAFSFPSISSVISPLVWCSEKNSLASARVPRQNCCNHHMLITKWHVNIVKSIIVNYWITLLQITVFKHE